MRDMPRGTPRKKSKAKGILQQAREKAEAEGRHNVTSEQLLAEIVAANPDPAPGDTTWQQVYIESLIRTAQKQKSADRARVTLAFVIKTRKHDPVFRKMEDMAMEMVGDMIESEVTRRAIDGVVTQRTTTTMPDGSIVTKETITYSDTLLLRMAERLETKSWRPRIAIDQNNTTTMIFSTREERQREIQRLLRIREEKAAEERLALGAGAEVLPYGHGRS